MLSITPPPAKKKMERLHRVGINSVNAEQLLERITSPEHCNILSGSCALGSFDGGLWIFHICLGELAQVTCMCTRFENLWLRGRLSTRPLPNPCLIYRYFCCKSMFAFLEKKKELHFAKLYTKSNRAYGKSRLSEEQWECMEHLLLSTNKNNKKLWHSYSFSICS